jgi:hypothetical protein
MATATAAACPKCSAPFVIGDRFCGSCGATLEAPAEVGGTGGSQPLRISATASASEVRAGEPGPGRRPDASQAEAPAAYDLLSVRLPFCRACGSDHEPSAVACPACGKSTLPLPRFREGRLGITYSLRRGLRKRIAVCVGEEAGSAKLLLESNETLLVALEELPEPNETDVASDETLEIRTPGGRLLRHAALCREGSTKRKWDPDKLESAALEAIGDEADARLLASDAIALESASMLERMPLTESERQWLLAIDAARRGDPEGVLTAVLRLPTDSYRPKLVLLVKAVRAIEGSNVEPSSLTAHLRPYLESEPIAGLLYRVLDPAGGAASSEPEIDQVLAESLTLAERLSMSAELAREVSLSLDLLAGASATDPTRVTQRISEHTTALTYLETGARTLLALGQVSPELMRQTDIDEVPLPILDDLIDRGAVDGEVVLAGSAEPHRSRYLTARIAPGRLSDSDVQQLEHYDEQVRRAFRYSDPRALEGFADSPIVTHYRSLLRIARGEEDEEIVDRVLPKARETVEDLMRLRSTASVALPSSSQALTERLVGDPTIWPVLVEIVGPTGLVPSTELQDRFPAFTEWLALHQAREHLFLGEWQPAVEAADLCFGLAKAEAVCDEALNLKACGLHNLGYDGRALGALEEALQGVRSEALLANAGVVAAGLDPEIAATHLGVLIDEAPTIELRVAAAHRTLDIWSVSDTESWRSSDNSSLPDAFQNPLRRLVVGPLELADFRAFARVLARYDEEWLADPSNIASSPHASSLEARFYVAQADNLPRMIAVMGEAMASGSSPDWIIRERDSLRSAAVDILFENLDEPDSAFGSVALAMVDHGVLASPEDTALLTALGIAGVSYHLSERSEEVSDRIVDLVRELRGKWQKLDSEDRDRVEPLIELATRRVAINRMKARGRDFDESVDLFNSAIDLGGQAQPGSPAYLKALERCQATANSCGAIRQEIRGWVPIVDHEGVREDLNELIEMTRDLERRCMEILN